MPGELSRRSFLAASVAVSAAAQTASRRPPNIVMLFADDMGYSDLSCYGNPTIRTPNLDRMAAEGMRFTSFYAASAVCTPSRVGLLTGRYPVRAGLPNNLGPDSKKGLPLTEVLIPGVLKQRGYKSMAIGKWHIGHDPVDFLPTSRGFDSYFGLLYSNDMIPPFVKTNRPLELYRDTKPAEPVTDQSNLTVRYTEEAQKFIASAGQQPFFLYLAYSMPHLPVSTTAEFRGKSRGGLYGDVIETIDWSAGQILKTLKDRGLDGNTLVVFASDNGPWHNLPGRMLQKGNEPWHTGSKSMFRGAKGTTWEGGIRVPGIVRYPGVVPPGQVNADAVSTLDLLPTFAALAGAKVPADRKYDGFDLMPLLTGKAKQSPRNTFYYFSADVLDGVRDGAWKLRIEGGKPELYHLDNDPAEMYDVAASNGGVVDMLLGKMRAFATEVGAKLVLPQG